MLDESELSTSRVTGSHPLYHDFSASLSFYNFLLYSYLLYSRLFVPIGVGVVGARTLSQLTGGQLLLSGLEHPVVFISFSVVLADVSACIAY